MNVESLWFGSEASMMPYLRYLDYLSNASANEIQAFHDSDEDDGEMPQLAQIEGSVGMVNINGSLIPNGNWITRMFGMTGYDEIAEAAAYLHEAEEVDSIVLSINSGGGSVMGLESVGNTLKTIAKDKPMYANTEGGMMSAAYWLGSVAQDVSATPMASLGSIGTIITHMSVARALKEDGKDVTIIRSGKYKAMGHPAEKLTDKAKAKMQADADKMTGFFREHVQDQRGMSLGNWDSWGEGKTFFADEAVSVGLADRLVNLSELVTQLNSKANHEETTDMKKKVILQDDQAVAQLESGVPLAELDHQQVEETPEAEATAEESPEVEAVAEDQAPEVEAVEADASEAETAEENTLVAHLKGELAEVRTELSEAKVAHAAMKADLDKMQASQAPLISIAAASVSKMQIGLGQTPASSLGSMTAEAIIEQHSATSKQFNDTFHVGQRSAEAPVDNADAAEVTPLHLGIFPKAN